MVRHADHSKIPPSPATDQSVHCSLGRNVMCVPQDKRVFCLKDEVLYK